MDSIMKKCQLTYLLTHFIYSQEINMKKLIAIFLLTLSFNTINAQYTQMPDTNFEQVLINQNIDSEGLLDGQILTSDINKIEFLDVSQSSIHSLIGIEGFTNLKQFFCFSNLLVDLDFSSNLLL
jgi:hypothetical protein